MVTHIARLDSRALVQISGPDARPFLHTLLTQDIECLASGQLAFGALLSPPGKLLFDLFVMGRDDGVMIDVAATRRDALIQRLTMYRLRAAVTITALHEPVMAAWRDAAPTRFIADPRLGAMGWRGYGAIEAPTTTEADYHAHRLSLGVPDSDLDAPSDTAYPIEANLDLLNGIDFTKGCFVGQETTSRMKRRGTIKTRMLPVAFDGPAPAFGTEILNGELRAGSILSGQPGMAMALMRLDRLEGELTIEGRPVTVRLPDWFPAPVPSPGSPAPSD